MKFLVSQVILNKQIQYLLHLEVLSIFIIGLLISIPYKYKTINIKVAYPGCQSCLVHLGFYNTYKQV